MDRIIRQILQIDADAQQKLQDAYRRREELISKADKEAGKKRKNCGGTARKKSKLSVLQSSRQLRMRSGRSGKTRTGR